MYILSYVTEISQNYIPLSLYIHDTKYTQKVDKTNVLCNDGKWSRYDNQSESWYGNT